MLQQRLFSSACCSEHRTECTAFTRCRRLSFPAVVLLMVIGHQRSLQRAVTVFTRQMQQPEYHVSDSAYSQARSKIAPEVFLDLHRIVVEMHEQPSPEHPAPLRLWCGRRLLACDTSILNLPDTPELRRRFSVVKNQSQQYVQGQISICFDVLNDIGVSIAVGRLSSEPAYVLEHHLKEIPEASVTLFDRGYGDYTMLAAMLKSGRDFILRCSGQSFAAVRDFIAGQETDTELCITAPDHRRVAVKKQGLPVQMRLRAVKILLPNGELEILLTSLLDTETFSKAALGEAYKLRWEIETFFDRIKNIYDLERFSGQSLNSIEQDIYGIFFLATLEAILIEPVQETFDQHHDQRPTMYRKHVNRALSYGTLLDAVVVLLLDTTVPLETMLEHLYQLFADKPTLERPNRHFPREKTSHAKQLRFRKYKKKNLL
jgi:hypothetical protein